MPNWRDDNTDRLFIDITVDGHGHTVKARLAPNSPIGAFIDAQERIALCYQAVQSFLGNDFTVKKVRRAVFGESGSSPLTPAPGWADVVGGRAPRSVHTAKYLNLVGTSPGRSHTSIKLWGVELVALNEGSNDYRFTSTEMTSLAGITQNLDNPTPLFVCRNGQQAIFNPGALARVSAYWQTELRK